MNEANAELLFAEFLRQGPDADFANFCREYPVLAPRLRELKSAHERACAAAATLAAADASHLPQAGDTPAVSSDLLARIVAQGAKGARYALRGEIARGGMGAILKVWDEDLGRELAMKVVLGRDGEKASGVTPGVDGRRIARFLEEAQVTGQLDHPCVVPVHELGLDSNGRIYFTMRLVRGRDLDRIFNLVFAGQEGWTETRALSVLLRACEAMAYAHSKGVIHRDLKPANVMIGSFGEVYVMDWGLARVQGRVDTHDLRVREMATAPGVRTTRGTQGGARSDSGLMTMEGEVIGTPAYMPPEQARGSVEEISARSDVYAIGAMLYHLLARQMPYVPRGESWSGIDVLRAVLDRAPTPLRRLRADVPVELEAICEKAMARDPGERYADTLALAEDLRAFLEGRVVKAHQTGAIVELRKWILRNKPLAAAAVLALVFLVAGLLASLVLWRAAQENAALALLRATQAADNAKLAQEQRTLALDNAKLADERAGQAIASADRSEAMLNFLQGMLAKANPALSMERDIKVSTVVDQAVKQLDGGLFAARPELEYGMRSALGDTYASLSLLEESERQFRLADELQKGLTFADPLERIRFEVEFADTLVARSKFAEGQALAQIALDSLEGMHAAECVPMARALHLLASARYNQGSTPEALAFMRRSLAVREAVDGADGEETARARAKLAFYLLQDRKLDEALALLNRALGVLQNGSAQARFDASESLRYRAGVYQTRREHKLAETDLRAALAIRETLLGEESIGVADLLNELASLLAVTNQLDEAEELAQRALAVRRKLLGAHRDTATALTTLAVVKAARGEVDNARALLKESLEMRLEVFGPDSSAIGDSLRRMGKLELDSGQLDAADKLLSDALESWKKSLRPEHVDLALIELDLARIRQLRAQWPEAAALFEHALALQAAAYGETNPNTNDTRDRLISTWIQAKDFSHAEALLREILPKYEADSPKGSAMVAYTGAQLGAVLVRQERFDEAEPLLLAGWKAIGENPRMWAVNKLLILDHLILLYEARGDEASAQLYREKAAKLRK